jgi:hypothetical protein
VTAVGAPDYQSAQQWSDNAVILTGLQHVVAGSVVLGPFPVSQWLGLSLFVGNTPNVALGVQLSYWADQAATIETASRGFVLGPSQAVPTTITLPNLGAYVTMQLNNSTGPAADWPLTLAGTNRIGPTVIPQAATPLLSQWLLAIGAGATQTTDLAYFFTGHAHFEVFCGAATGEYRIEQLDESGAIVARLGRRGFPQPGQGDFLSPFYLPPGWLRFVVTNSSGAASTVSASIVPESWSSYA